MTAPKDDDLIRRGDVIAALDRHAKGDAVIGGQHYRTLTLEVASEAIAAIPADPTITAYREALRTMGLDPDKIAAEAVK